MNFKTANSSKLILVVDDIPDNIRLLASILKKAGYETALATNGLGAIEFCRRRVPDLILLDILMPNMDGMETCRRIRANHTLSDVPIIFVTALTTDDDISEGFDVGCSDYIKKPFKAKELIARVRTQFELADSKRKAQFEADKLEGLFQSLKVGIALCSPDGHVLQSNAFLATMLGLPKGSIDGMQIWSVMPSKSQADRLADAFHSIATEIPPTGRIEFKIEPLQSRPSWIELTLEPIRSIENNVESVAVAMYDVTIRKSSEEIQLDVERIMQHDLKAPLTGIIGIADALSGLISNPTQETAEFLGLLRDSGFKMLAMINRKMDLCKMENGVYQLSIEKVDLADMLRTMILEINPLLSARHVQLRVSFNGHTLDSESKAVISAEKILCHSILSNLIKNAIEASPPKNIVDVQIECMPNGIQITIANDGLIPAEIRARFFEKYATSGKTHGTGLGAYAAKLMVDTLGGSIRAVSDTAADRTYITVNLPFMPPPVPTRFRTYSDEAQKPVKWS